MERRNAQVRLVDAVGAHRLRVGQARERRGDVVARRLSHARLHQRLDHFEDRVLLRERHFQIDLRELRLAVGAQIFVAEAAHDLEILVEAADHQKLFENLRRLRQRVEVAGIDAAGHQIIARAFRRRARHERRFDFEKPMLGQRLAHGEGDLRAQNDIALHVRAAQIDVAILQARVFLDVDVFFHRERRRARFVQDPELLDHHFHFAGRDGGIDGVRRRAASPGLRPRSRIRRRAASDFLVQLRRRVGVEDELRDALAVAQVDEQHAAQIAAAMHPAHQDGAFAGVGRRAARRRCACGAVRLENREVRIPCSVF